MTRRWSLRELRLNAAIRHAHQAEEREREALGRLGEARRFARGDEASAGKAASLGYDTSNRKA
jgi:hypothetical protein